ncbi:MAG: DUF2868 domain-containing protein [Burkholderiales bacterium]|nr:DUF2868 domain-containing protein [Burkholderiales bacterium]
MNEAAAREVLLLQAFESVSPASPSWTDEDRGWATKLALHGGAAQADPGVFIEARAHHAMQRLAAREPAAARWLGLRLWHARWPLWAALVAALVGVLADSIGSSQRINLLAPPLWGVLLWNLLVYVLLFVHAVGGLTRPNGPRPPGPILRLVQRGLRWGRELPASGASGGSEKALQSFATHWLRVSAPLNAVRASALLHTASAALAIGLIAGLYLRGLVLDYRATWESTFVTAQSAHAALAFMFAPAQALSGIALPDVAGFEALRSVPGDTSAGATAAPWIHLWALTLLLFVVLPRSLLALWSTLRAQRLARRVTLPLTEPYFQRLTQLQRGDAARVQVLPYANTPTPQAVLGLRALLADAFGERAALQIAPTLAFGAEDDAAAQHPLPPGTTLAVALFDLAATPEAENQGRFVRLLAARAPAGAATIVLVDETGFVRRFGSDATRLAQRREAWRRFAETLASVPVFAALDAPDLAATRRALQAAMGTPVR